MSDITDNPETPRSAGRRGGSARRGAMDPVTSSPGRDLPAFEDESHLLDGDDGPGRNWRLEIIEGVVGLLTHTINLEKWD